MSVRRATPFTPLRRLIVGAATLIASFAAVAQPLSLAPVANVGYGDRLPVRAHEIKPVVHLAGFPSGRITLQGVAFDFVDPVKNSGRTVLQLSGGASSVELPAGDIKAEHLHFLHAAAQLNKTSPELVATYTVVYADGAESPVAIRRAHEISDWWGPRDTPSARVVWSGYTIDRHQTGLVLHSWKNPHPDKPVAKLRFKLENPSAVVALVGVSAGPAASSARDLSGMSDYDRYGGWKKLQGMRTGFFRTEQINGRHWLVTPDGNVFLSKGVNSVVYYGRPENPDRASYPVIAAIEENRWYDDTFRHLDSWHFNTAAGWVQPAGYRRPYTPVIDFLNTPEAGGHWFKRIAPDLWRPEFVQGAERLIRESVLPIKNDPLCIGYYINNEGPWMKGADSFTHVLVQYLAFKSPGSKVALEFVKERYPTIEALNAAWKPSTPYTSFDDLVANIARMNERKATLDDPFTRDCQAFACVVAEKFFSTVVPMLRAASPNHMILGIRVAWLNELNFPISEIGGKWFDVHSIQNYAQRPFIPLFEQLADRTGKPVIVSEFGARAMDGGHPNTHGAGSVVDTQAQRTRMMLSFAAECYKSRVVVGTHMFRLVDQPPEGRKQDGENSNYGLLKADNTPWPEITDGFTALNRMAEELHER